MVTIVPPTLLNLAGLPEATAESHIRPGNHLRVSHNPVFGLPVAPFILQRARLDQLPGNFGPRRDIVFRDAKDRILDLPISVKKGDVIRATIVQGEGLACIFLGMTSQSIDSGMRESLSGALRMQVYGPSIGYGPVLVGERRSAPYNIGAPVIAEAVITGQGVITDMAWIAAQDLDQFNWDTIDVLNLPHNAGARYLSISDPRDRAEKRLRLQAPQRRPLQETSGAPTSSSVPGFSDKEESDRVHALSVPLDKDLDVLIDGPALPLVAAETLPITDAMGRSLATGPGEDSSVTIGHLARVLQGSLDPGVAAWLGYKALDQKINLTEDLNFYRVIGFFQHPLSLGANSEVLRGLPINLIPQSDRQMTGQNVFNYYLELAFKYLAQEGQSLVGKLMPANDYLMMAAVAVIDQRAIPEPPPLPQMLAPEHVFWLPAIPPAAQREIDCPLKDVLVGATLAVIREQPPGSFALINRKIDGTPWHIPLTLGLSGLNDGQPLFNQNGRQGTITDRAAGPEGVQYHIAQQDRFGRWSPFTIRDAAPGPRPKPPRPVVQGSYRQPTLADAATSGGTLLLRVLLPELESLAPGSFELSHAQLSFRHHSVTAPAMEIAMPDIDAAVSTAITIEETPSPDQTAHRAIPVILNGPVLAPTEQRRIVITTIWVDVAGQQSVVSEPLRLLMTDPRPPAQMPISEILLYSSRPDATGLAWVERNWAVPATNTPIYAAYYTDEVRLLSWLAAEGRQAEATEIGAITDRAVRASRFRAIHSDFPDHLFERIPDAIDASVTTTRRMRHALSGSSRVLNAYKIATEAPASGVRPDLSELDMVFYGIPNSDPPPRPRVTVRMVPPSADEPKLVVEVTVTQETGVTHGEKVRIYRTSGGLADPLYAPLITTLSLPSPDPQTGQQVRIFRDVGAAQIAPSARLTAFVRYQWIAEVQGAPESGSSVPGLWSRPSDPVGLAVVPLTGPSEPFLDGFSGIPVAEGTKNLTLTFSHSLNLQPTVLGYWRLEIMRKLPGKQWSLMSTYEIRKVPMLVPVPAPNDITPLETRFRVTLYDPLGRSAPTLELTLGRNTIATNM